MVDPIFNMFKVKFTTLDSLNILHTDANRVDIFINLEMVFKILLTPRENNELKASVNETTLKLNLISNIINLAQHYRLYCNQPKYRKDSRIYLYWNYPKDKYLNRKYISTYREYYDHRMHNNIGCEYILRCLDESVDILTKITKYVNQVYLINGHDVDSSMIPLLIESDIYHDMDNTSVQKIIISNEKYDYQYVNYGFELLDCDRDKSIILNKENCIDIMKQKMRLSKNKIIIPPNFIPFALALIGNKYRNIPKMAGVGLGTILKVVDTAIKQLLVTENTRDVESLAKILTEKYQIQFIQNYKCTDLEAQYELITPVNIVEIERQIEDKYDDVYFNTMNEKFFKLNPIMRIDTKTEQVRDEKQFAVNYADMWN